MLTRQFHRVIAQIEAQLRILEPGCGAGLEPVHLIGRAAQIIGELFGHQDRAFKAGCHLFPGPDQIEQAVLRLKDLPDERLQCGALLRALFRAG